MNKDFQKFYEALSKVQDELNACCNSNKSFYTGAKIDIEIDVDKSLSAWIFIYKSNGSHDLVSQCIKSEGSMEKAVSKAKDMIMSMTKDTRIAELQKQIDELKASA